MARRSRAIALMLAFLLVPALALAAGCGESPGSGGDQGGEAPAPSGNQSQAGGTQNQAAQTVPTGRQLLTNGDFAAGLSGWEVIDQGGSRVHGTNLTEAVNAGGGPAARFYRVCPEKDGGAAGVRQALQVQLSQGDSLTLLANIKVDNQRGGAIAGSDSRWYPEGAVQFRIYYTKADGSTGEWYHGFYYGEVAGADTSHFTRVSQGQWEKYKETRLAEEILGDTGQPVTITEFRAYGFGWDFEGYAAALSLIKN